MLTASGRAPVHLGWLRRAALFAIVLGVLPLLLIPVLSTWLAGQDLFVWSWAAAVLEFRSYARWGPFVGIAASAVLAAAGWSSAWFTAASGTTAWATVGGVAAVTVVLLPLAVVALLALITAVVFVAFAALLGVFAVQLMAGALDL